MELYQIHFRLVFCGIKMYHNHIKIFGIISIGGAAPKLSCGDS